MNLYLEAACGCNMGKVRGNNEDNLYFERKTYGRMEGFILPEEHKNIEKSHSTRIGGERVVSFAIFDGVGGEADGQTASWLAAKTIMEDRKAANGEERKPEYFLVDVIEHMNDVVWKESERRNCHMGTTAVILYFYERELYICNVGDSKAYRLRDRKLRQISQDHTDAEFLKQQNIRNRKPSLTQCIGISPEEMVIEPYLARCQIEPDDVYLICSDGLTDMVEGPEIGRILHKYEDTERCVRHLVHKALENGGRDNVTAIVVRVKTMELEDTVELEGSEKNEA